MSTTSKDRSKTLIAPSPWIRLLLLLLGLGLSAIGVLFLTMTTRTSFQILDAALVPIGLFFGIRLARSGILLDDNALAIRGVFWTTTLQRPQITSTDLFPYIDWNKADGSAHRSFLYVYTGVSDGNDPNGREKRRAKSQLDDWIAKRTGQQQATD